MVNNNPGGTQARFGDRLRARARQIGSWLCVGIDPDPKRLPHGFAPDAAGVRSFCTAIIQATADQAVAYKLNTAFFEALGPDGWKVLASTRDVVPDGIPVIADAKRGDIGNTAEAYARAILDVLDFDAMTVNPYLGWDSLEPYLERPGKGVLVLAKTSNPGAGELQDLDVQGEPLYLYVARSAVRRPADADVGLVVGATKPDAVQRVRAIDDDTILLLPGVGAQGATVEQAMAAGANGAGENALVTVSRDILYASSGADFAERAVEAAARLAAETRQHS